MQAVLSSTHTCRSATDHYRGKVAQRGMLAWHVRMTITRMHASDKGSELCSIAPFKATPEPMMLSLLSTLTRPRPGFDSHMLYAVDSLQGDAILLLFVLVFFFLLFVFVLVIAAWGAQAGLRILTGSCKHQG